MVERDPQRQELDREEVWVGRLAALGIGTMAIAIALIGGAGLNVAFMVGLAFAVAASATFPALLLALIWRRFNTTGAVTGVLFGVVSAIGLIIMSPTVWPGPDSEGSPFGLANPGIISIPLGFIGCWLGTMLSREEVAGADVRRVVRPVGTRLGAEQALGGRVRRPIRPAAVTRFSRSSRLAPLRQGGP